MKCRLFLMFFVLASLPLLPACTSVTSLRLQEWEGTWTRNSPDDSASIDIERTEEKTFGIAGLALWHDHVGVLGESDDEGKPVLWPIRVEGDHAVVQEDECKVTIRKKEAFLIVEDNNKCGGLNVTFSGTYKRKETNPKPPMSD